MISADESHEPFFPSAKGVFPNIHTVSVESKYLNRNQRLLISLPASHVETADNVIRPVIFVLDAELLFYPIAGHVYYQGMNSQMPDAIVVGLINDPGTRRDMTPTPLNNKGEPLWFGGKQDDYMEMLEKEIIPLIRKKYQAANYNILIGLSPTGQFALHTLWNRPNLFQAHIALNTADFSSSSYEGATAFDKIIQLINEKPSVNANLYISMPKQGGGSNPRILEAYEKLKNGFDNAQNKIAQLKIELIPHSGYAAALPAVQSALADLFPVTKWDPNYRNFFSDEPGKTLQNIKHYYDALSQEYGFQAFPKGERYYNRNRLKRIGYVLLQQGRTEEAIAIFKYWQSLYPKAANAYDSLADAYEKQGNKSKASEMRKKASTLARQNKDYREHKFAQ